LRKAAISTRDDIVKSHVAVYGDVAPGDIAAFRKGARLVDESGAAVPFYLEEYSENISRAYQIVFAAKGVLPVGYKTYYLVAGQPDDFRKAARIQLDRDKDRNDPRRSPGNDTIENDFYRVTIDRATGRTTLFDKQLNHDVARNIEIAGVEEKGGNYIGIEPVTGRTFPGIVDEIKVEENNAVRTVVRIATHVAEVPVTQRLMLYHGLKRLDIENTAEWTSARFIRLEQLFPLAQTGAEIRYGVPFGSNTKDNVLPNTGPHQPDEITKESWLGGRHVHDWIHAGNAEWGLTIATDHQQVRLGDGLIRAEMLRGARFSSAKVVRGEEVTSMFYPPPGKYVFHYSLSSAAGDWKASKAYRAGMAFTNPLLPVVVEDAVSSKSLPPAQAFCAVKQDSVIISAIKKADLDSSVLVRVYEMEGNPVRTPLEFLGIARSFTQTNLLEEVSGATPAPLLEAGPYTIRTLKLPVASRTARAF
jgi:alpha-mannosidase